MTGGRGEITRSPTMGYGRLAVRVGGWICGSSGDFRWVGGRAEIDGMLEIFNCSTTRTTAPREGEWRMERSKLKQKH